MNRVHDLAECIVRRRISAGDRKPWLVALSGIDGSGKTTLARDLEDALDSRGFRVALIGADAWHHPASVRFSERDPAGHFYRNAFRFEEMFRRLIEPLRRDGSVTLTANLVKLSSDCSHPHTYLFRKVDIVLVEGIFLLRQDLRERYDLSFWIDCSFETALERSLARNQEGLTKDRLISDYERIYFPAQRIHLATDWPRFFADAILSNEESQPSSLVLARAEHPHSPRRMSHGTQQSL
jgi:uridine kinase